MNPALAARVGGSLVETCENIRPDIVSSVLARLGEAAVESASDSVEACFRQACHGLLLAEQFGEAVENEEDFLIDATFRRALDAKDAVGQTAEEKRALAAISADLRARFTQAELLPETLRVVYLQPDTESLFVDRVEAELNAAIDGALAARPCTGRASLAGRYALGTLTPDSEDYRSAAEHLQGCENCRRHAKRVRVLAAACEPSPELSALAAARAAALAKRPTRLASARATRPAGKIAIGAAVAAALLVGAFTVFGPAGEPSPPTVSASSTAAQLAKASELRAAEADRKAKAARERRAERLRAKRAAAKRRAAKRRAAKRRAAAARAAALARARQTTTRAVPQTQVPTQTSTPKTKSRPQPKPSTDPSQEFGN